MRNTTPNARIGFVTFGEYVNVYGDGSNQMISVDNSNILDSFEGLVERATSFSNTHFSTSISNSYINLYSILKNMFWTGSTALGPGLVIST